MRKIYRKLILASSTMIATALTLTTTTWAWFKINSKATVSFAEFEVVSGNGFYVSIDNNTFTNSLSSDQIKKAILVGYDSEVYEIKPYTNYQFIEDGRYTESEMEALGYLSQDVLYKIKTEEVGTDGSFKKIYEELKGSDLDDEIDKIMNDKINLWPVTSTNGVDFTTLSSGKTTYKGNSGYYAQFPVYFKTVSNKTSDKQKYDIYLNGYSGLDEQGNSIIPTSIRSQAKKIKLNAGLTTYQNGEIKKYNSGEKIEVYSSNSIRMSSTIQKNERYVKTTDTVYEADKAYYVYIDGNYTEVSSSTYNVGDDIDDTVDSLYEINDKINYQDDVSTSLIYEVNDTLYGDKNLGSYATDYNIEYVKTTDSEMDVNKIYYKIKYEEFNGSSFESGVEYYEKNGNEYNLTDDLEKQSGKQYYIQAYEESSDTSFNQEDEYYEKNSDYFMYNCDYNAMYTYYNKLVNNERKLKALHYEDLPTNIISKLPSYRSDKLTKATQGNQATESSYVPMVTLKSGYASERIMFRVWLEGWDADNIDGLANPVDIRLAFSAKKVSWE